MAAAKAIVDEEAMIQGQIDIWKRLFVFAEPMLLKCAVELRIPDILHSNTRPISLSQLAASIDSPSINFGYLHRIMRGLVRLNIFTATKQSDEETLYGLTPSSMALLHDSETSLAPFLLMQNHPILLSSWHYLNNCVKQGGSGFKKAHGYELFEMASFRPELNKIFNGAMRCSAKMVTKAILSVYRDGFNGIESVVDVGGGMGHLIAEIAKEVPHIKGINFDLPHVIAAAQEDNNWVSHVAGDMFDFIPTADAIFMRGILHDWGDEDCIKILKNCRKALAEKNGKVVIVEIVLKEDRKSDAQFGNLDVIFDIAMMAHCVDGKERSDVEWKKLLEEGGFSRCNIIKLPSFVSVVEAYAD